MGKLLHDSHKTKISTEMYIKTIYLLEKSCGRKIRPVELSKELKIAKASVSEMLRKLTNEGYIEYESFKPIVLTEKGQNLAKNMTRKYELIRMFLSKVLEVPEQSLHEEACRLEHCFSERLYIKLQAYMKSHNFK